MLRGAVAEGPFGSFVVAGLSGRVTREGFDGKLLRR